MSLSIVAYVDRLATRLAALTPRYRRCFAIWCAHEIASKFGDRIFGTRTTREATFISDALVAMWSHVVENTTPTAGYLSHVREWCEAIDIDKWDELAGFLLAELLSALSDATTVLEKDDPEQAASTAEAVINCIDAVLSEQQRHGPVEYNALETPDIVREIGVQEAFIRYLEQRPELEPADLHRYRPML